jgi:hypothetical protein
MDQTNIPGRLPTNETNYLIYSIPISPAFGSRPCFCLLVGGAGDRPHSRLQSRRFLHTITEVDRQKCGEGHRILRAFESAASNPLIAQIVEGGHSSGDKENWVPHHIQYMRHSPHSYTPHGIRGPQRPHQDARACLHRRKQPFSGSIMSIEPRGVTPLSECLP